MPARAIHGQTSRPVPRRAALAAALLSVVALAGCDPFLYGELEDEAGVRVIEAPDGFPRGEGFGDALSTYEGSVDGAEVSRIGVSGGANTPYFVFDAWNAGGLGLGPHRVEGCDEAGDCEEGAGAAVAGIPVWRASTPSEGRLCLLVTAPSSGVLRIRCETSGSTTETLTAPMGIDFGAAIVPLPAAGGAGVALVGAPRAAGGAGELYRLPDGAGPVPLVLPAGTTTAVGRLGSGLAVTSLGAGRTLVAAWAPGAQRVVVFVLAADGSATVHACLDGASDGFGSALALGDLDADGAPELIVGASPAAPGPGAAPVEVYPGTGLPAAGACGPWGAAATQVLCPDALRGVECAGAGFGRSLAIGDLDADGAPELLVGAPWATVDGDATAGAVLVFEGSTLAPLDALTHSSPEAGDELGTGLAVVRTSLGPGRTPRDEPVAVARGKNALVVFLCSGVPGDGTDVGALCIPE